MLCFTAGVFPNKCAGLTKHSLEINIGPENRPKGSQKRKILNLPRIFKGKMGANIQCF